jgi:NAD(P)H-dependent flavin oxidoreductase YrpB (nitropropane dioxygenase family)
MAIRTRFTELFQVAHPLVLAPMGGVSGGALAAAVSEAGGLGRALRNAFVDSWDGREAEPTANLVTRIMAQAEGLLRGAPRQLGH